MTPRKPRPPPSPNAWHNIHDESGVLLHRSEVVSRVTHALRRRGVDDPRTVANSYLTNRPFMAQFEGRTLSDLATVIRDLHTGVGRLPRGPKAERGEPAENRYTVALTDAEREAVERFVGREMGAWDLRELALGMVRLSRLPR